MMDLFQLGHVWMIWTKVGHEFHHGSLTAHVAKNVHLFTFLKFCITAKVIHGIFMILV